MHSFFDSFQSALGLGLEPKSLSFLQISLRGLVVFAVSLIMIRLSDRRGLTKKSPFDLILVVILASVLARAVNGSSSFFPTVGGAAVLVLAHRILALACCHSPTLNALVKGRPSVLVRAGKLQKKTMHREHISEGDLLEDLRLTAEVEELDKVDIARLEVGGDISFILQKKG